MAIVQLWNYYQPNLRWREGKPERHLRITAFYLYVNCITVIADNRSWESLWPPVVVMFVKTN